MTSGFLIIAFFWLLNFGISWFNAWGAGKAWAEAKAAGGWFRFMTWMAAAMSACGFIWCYLVFEALALNGIGFLDAQMTKLVLEAGYLILAPAIVGHLSDWLAPDHIANAQSLRTALLVLAPTGLWAAYHYFRSARNIVADQERATGVKVQE